jgi:hypothetical protein
VRQDQASNAMASSGSGAISSASRLGVSLIMLGGGRYMEAMRTHGIARPTVYSTMWKVVDAINAHPNLAIEMDNTPTGIRKRASRFREKSSYGLFEYCTETIDGLAIPIDCPRHIQGDGTIIYNTKRFFDGSHKFNAINVQIVNDADCVVDAFTANHVGSTFDGDAFQTCSLKQLMMELPFPYHWVGDSAYPVSQWLHVPYPGVNLHRTNPFKESYNFYESQIRINSERTNGIFIRRWGIFWHQLAFDLKNIIKIIHACLRLHNFVTKRRLPTIHCNARPPPPHVAVDDDGRLIDDRWRRGAEPTPTRDNISVCSLREDILATITRNNYKAIRSHNRPTIGSNN